MADHKQQLLQELLKEHQEPFRLKNYIAERRSQLRKPPLKTILQLKKQRPVESASTCFARPRSLCKHACFLSIQSSPDVRKSPFAELPSPLKSPCKSPAAGAAVFLHVPSRTAAVLLEAAIRIQKEQQSKSNKAQFKNAGFGLFGSLLKRLKDRSKNKPRAIGANEFDISINREGRIEGDARISCSCNDSTAPAAEASTSSCFEEMVEGDFISEELRFCESPFRFSLRRSASCSGSTGSCTPEFCSPAASPRLPIGQEKENSKNIQGEEEDEEHCSPVSILDPPFEDDEGHESEEEAEDDDYHLEGSYANVQRAKQQLLHRLRRFEKLAELDPLELERKMLDSSDEESDQEPVLEPDQDDPISRSDTFLMSMNLKDLVGQPVVDGKGKLTSKSNREVINNGRISNMLDSWKEVKFDTIDEMITLDFKMDFGGWKGFREQVEEMVAELEPEIFEMLVEELSGEVF